MATRVKNFIGIDISKEWFNVSILQPANKSTIDSVFDNTPAGLDKFYKTLREYSIGFNSKTIVTMEHTGVYTTHLINYLIKKKARFCVEMSLRIKRSMGITRGKNDWIDAKRIAEYSFKNLESLTLYNEPIKSISHLKMLLTYREKLIKVRIMHDNLTKAFLSFQSKAEVLSLTRLSGPLTRVVKQSYKDVEKEISEIVKASSLIHHQFKLLLGIPGIGKITALSLICYTNAFTNFATAKQLASYCGVAPFEISSGSTVMKTRTSRISNRRLKRALHTSAVVCLRLPEFKKYYKRKVAEGKPKLSVINAIRNKLIKRVVAVIRRDTPYKTGAQR